MPTSIPKPTPAFTSPENTCKRISVSFCLTGLRIPSIQVATTAFESSCHSFCEKIVVVPSLGNQSFLV